MYNVKKEYVRIMQNEKTLSGRDWLIPNPPEMYQTALQIAEYAHNSMVLRSYNRIYGMTRKRRAYESVGAHANLASAIFDRAYSDIHWYNHSFIEKEPGVVYSYREFIEAIRRHDLPENVMGDIPDDGKRDERQKHVAELTYHAFFEEKYPRHEEAIKEKVSTLLEEMEEKSTPAGRFLYSVDKASAIIMALEYDFYKESPMRRINARNLSKRDRDEMARCDTIVHKFPFKYCLASEMWTNDWFEARKLVDYDESGFMTALIVMRTLQVHEKWYSWRQESYN